MYRLVFSDGKSTLIGEETLEWIRYHGAKGVLRIVRIIDEDGNDLLEVDPDLRNRVFR